MMYLIKDIFKKIVVGILGAIQTLLIVLRFIGVITCSWYIVFLPLIILAILSLLVAIICKLIKR